MGLDCTRLSLYLYNIGCGSAIQKPKNEAFWVLVLHSPFTIFVKKNGGGGVTKREILRNKGIRKQF